MKDFSNIVWRVLRAVHARLHRQELITEYGQTLADIQQDEPKLESLALQR